MKDDISGKSIRITGFTPEDEAQTQDFCKNIFSEMHWPLSYMDADITQEFSNKGDLFLLVKQGVRIIGCGGLKNLSEGTALITRLFIARRYRKMGLGSIIFKRLEDEARQLGYKIIVLDVEHINQAAIKLYKKQGMEPFIPTPHPRWKESAPGEKKYSRYYSKRL